MWIANKDLVVAFYQQAYNDNEPEQAAAGYLDRTFTQHLPGAQDGPEAFIHYVHRLHEEFPRLHLQINYAIAEGEYVVTHSNPRLEPGRNGLAVAGFWRVLDDKIVEHWDVIQAARADSESATSF